MARRTVKAENGINSPDLEELENNLGYKFRDRAFLSQALMHRSYLNELSRLKEPKQSNERLEFLGDAVLNFVSANFLYQRFSQLPEGELTLLRAALVRMETLEIWARRHLIGPFLLLSSGEAQSGGRERRTILGRTFESIIGAIFLDGGIEEAEKFLVRLLSSEIEIILDQRLHLDEKTLLQEAAQARFHITPSYHTVDSSGPESARIFAMEVRLGDRIVGRGSGRTKQEAAMQAAAAALDYLDLRSDNVAQTAR